MKSIVVYRSKSGFVRKYAEWIAEELGADLFEAARVTPGMLACYDAIVYGGGLYAVGINGSRLITRNLGSLKGKKIAVFATGASPAREETIAEVRDNNFTPAELEHIRFFYLRGGFDFSKLTPVDKVLMTLMKWKIKLKKESNRSSDEQGMLLAYAKPVDFTRKAHIEPLIAYIRS